MIARFFIILFRPRKRIEEIYLNYSTEHLFDNSYIIINYRYRNAIYYRFGKHKTLEKQIKIFDLKNLDKEIDFVVFGFFRCKKYKLKFEPQLTLNNSSFKTTFSSLKIKLVERIIPKLSHPNIYCDFKKPVVNSQKIKIKQIKIKQLTIKISNIPFNLNEFI